MPPCSLSTFPAVPAVTALTAVPAVTTFAAATADACVRVTRDELRKAAFGAWRTQHRLYKHVEVVDPPTHALCMELERKFGKEVLTGKWET